MKKLSLSSALNIHEFPKDDYLTYIRQCFTAHKELGFDAVDFSGRTYALMGDQPEVYIEKTLEIAREVGLTIPHCHLPFGVSPETPADILQDFEKRVYREIDYAKLLGVDYAVLHPNSASVPRDSFDRQAQYDVAMAHLGPFVEYANRLGVRIVVENMRLVYADYPVQRYCADPEDLCTLADALGIGVCWDTGHAHITGLKQSDAIRYVGDRLKMLHINDNFAGDDIHLAPFMGTLDWKDAMAGLAAIDYNGVLNFEVGAGRQPAGPRKAFAAYLVAAGQELLAMMDA